MKSHFNDEYKEYLLQILALSIEDLEEKNISKCFDVNRAKDITDILFINRLDFKTQKNIFEYAEKLFVICSKYHRDNTKLNLILGEGSLEPKGTIDTTTIGPLYYESMY